MALGADGRRVPPSLVTSELVAPRLTATVVQVAQPTLLWVAVVALAHGEGNVTAGIVGAIGSLLLLEWQANRRPGGIPIVAGVLGVTAGMGLTLEEPWATAAVAG